METVGPGDGKGYNAGSITSSSSSSMNNLGDINITIDNNNSNSSLTTNTSNENNFSVGEETNPFVIYANDSSSTNSNTDESNKPAINISVLASSHINSSIFVSNNDSGISSGGNSSINSNSNSNSYNSGDTSVNMHLVSHATDMVDPEKQSKENPTTEEIYPQAIQNISTTNNYRRLREINILDNISADLDGLNDDTLNIDSIELNEAGVGDRSTLLNGGVSSSTVGDVDGHSKVSFIDLAIETDDGVEALQQLPGVPNSVFNESDGSNDNNYNSNYVTGNNLSSSSSEGNSISSNSSNSGSNSNFNSNNGISSASNYANGDNKDSNYGTVYPFYDNKGPYLIWNDYLEEEYARLIAMEDGFYAEIESINSSFLQILKDWNLFEKFVISNYQLNLQKLSTSISSKVSSPPSAHLNGSETLTYVLNLQSKLALLALSIKSPSNNTSILTNVPFANTVNSINNNSDGNSNSNSNSNPSLHDLCMYAIYQLQIVENFFLKQQREFRIKSKSASSATNSTNNSNGNDKSGNEKSGMLESSTRSVFADSFIVNYEKERYSPQNLLKNEKSITFKTEYFRKTNLVLEDNDPTLVKKLMKKAIIDETLAKVPLKDPTIMHQVFPKTAVRHSSPSDTNRLTRSASPGASTSPIKETNINIFKSVNRGPTSGEGNSSTQGVNQSPGFSWKSPSGVDTFAKSPSPDRRQNIASDKIMGIDPESPMSPSIRRSLFMNSQYPLSQLKKMYNKLGLGMFEDLNISTPNNVQQGNGANLSSRLLEKKAKKSGAVHAGMEGGIAPYTHHVNYRQRLVDCLADSDHFRLKGLIAKKLKKTSGSSESDRKSKVNSTQNPLLSSAEANQYSPVVSSGADEHKSSNSSYENGNLSYGGDNLSNNLNADFGNSDIIALAMEVTSKDNVNSLMSQSNSSVYKALHHSYDGPMVDSVTNGDLNAQYINHLSISSKTTNRGATVGDIENIDLNTKRDLKIRDNNTTRMRRASVKVQIENQLHAGEFKPLPPVPKDHLHALTASNLSKLKVAAHAVTAANKMSQSTYLRNVFNNIDSSSDNALDNGVTTDNALNAPSTIATTDDGSLKSAAKDSDSTSSSPEVENRDEISAPVYVDYHNTLKNPAGLIKLETVPIDSVLSGLLGSSDSKIMSKEYDNSMKSELKPDSHSPTTALAGRQKSNPKEKQVVASSPSLNTSGRSTKPIAASPGKPVEKVKSPTPAFKPVVAPNSVTKAAVSPNNASSPIGSTAKPNRRTSITMVKGNENTMSGLWDKAHST